MEPDNVPTTEPMLTVANAMLLISVLRKQGWTVRISGQLQAEVQINSSDGEYSDFNWVAFGETTEAALLDAARQMHNDLSETVRLVGSCFPEGL